MAVPKQLLQLIGTTHIISGNLETSLPMMQPGNWVFQRLLYIGVPTIDYSKSILKIIRD